MAPHWLICFGNASLSKPTQKEFSMKLSNQFPIESAAPILNNVRKNKTKRIFMKLKNGILALAAVSFFCAQSAHCSSICAAAKRGFLSNAVYITKDGKIVENSDFKNVLEFVTKFVTLKSNGDCDYDQNQVASVIAFPDMPASYVLDEFRLATTKSSDTQLISGMGAAKATCSQKLLNQAEKYSALSSDLKAQYEQATGKRYDAKVAGFGAITGLSAGGSCLAGAVLSAATLGVGAPAGAALCVGGLALGASVDLAQHEQSRGIVEKPVQEGSKNMEESLAERIAVLDYVARDRKLVNALLYSSTPYGTPDYRRDDDATKTQAEFETMASANGINLHSHPWMKMIYQEFGACTGDRLPLMEDVFLAASSGMGESALNSGDDPRVLSAFGLTTQKERPSAGTISPTVPSAAVDSLR
jgi:hypothetical protein